MLDDTLKRLRDGLNEPVSAALRAAYEAGFTAGEASMKAKFRALVSDETPKQASLPIPMPAPSKTDAAGRALRGAVGKVVVQILQGSAGMRATEVEKLATTVDPTVSTKSVGNELRRYKDQKYHRDEEGRWHLVSN